MKEEVRESLKEAFCSELKDIVASVDANGGRFSSAMEVNNASVCIRAIRDIVKIEAMEAKSAASLR